MLDKILDRLETKSKEFNFGRVLLIGICAAFVFSLLAALVLLFAMSTSRVGLYPSQLGPSLMGWALIGIFIAAVAAMIFLGVLVSRRFGSTEGIAAAFVFAGFSFLLAPFITMALMMLRLSFTPY